MAHDFFTVYLLTVLAKFANAAYSEFQLHTDHPCPYPGYECANGTLHHMCRGPDDNSTCESEYIKMSVQEKQCYMDSMNRIRNQLAVDWRISNMNNLYWSDDLSKVAYSYLQLCTYEKDSCKIFGREKLAINSNRYLRDKDLKGDWPSDVVDAWFQEGGSKSGLFEEWVLAQDKYPGNYTNFTQLMWPRTKFFGCHSAQLTSDSYYSVCYFHPPNEEDFDEILRGRPCSRCAPLRGECSVKFPNLCGRDMILIPSNKQKEFLWQNFLGLTILLLLI